MKYRVSYQNHQDSVIRNRHARITADSAKQAEEIVKAYGNFIVVYKVEQI